MRRKTEHEQQEKGQTRSIKGEGVEERVVSSKKTRNDKVRGGSHGLHIFFLLLVWPCPLCSCYNEPKREYYLVVNGLCFCCFGQDIPRER